MLNHINNGGRHQLGWEEIFFQLLLILLMSVISAVNQETRLTFSPIKVPLSQKIQVASNIYPSLYLSNRPPCPPILLIIWRWCSVPGEEAMGALCSTPYVSR